MLDKELIKKATNELWYFHKLWLQAENDEEMDKLKTLANEINTRYAHASYVLDDFINNQISSLVNYFANTGLPMLNKEETIELIKKLEDHYATA